MNKPIFTKEQYDLLVDFVNDRIEDLDKDVEMMLFLPNENFEEGFRKSSAVLDKLRAIRTQLDENESILTSETFYRNEIDCESMQETIDEENDSSYDGVNLYYSSFDKEYYLEDTYSPYGDSACGSEGCFVKVKDYKKTWWLKGEKDDIKKSN